MSVDVGSGAVAVAAVEGTQGAEIVFALCLEMLTRQASLPSPAAWVGIAVIAAGLGLYVAGDRDP